MIFRWLEVLPKVPIDLMRDVLYNIEQFREDAFILPDINVKVTRPTVKSTGFSSQNRNKSKEAIRNSTKGGFKANSKDKKG
jgi:hypothetical protein